MVNGGTFQYGEATLDVRTALGLACGAVEGVLNANTRMRIRNSSQLVEEITRSEQVVYGINTGFGPLCTTRISPDQTRQLQENILKSHAVGVGEPLSLELSGLILVLKLHALALGFSGIREEVLDRILWHLENFCLPWIPSQGSVGASGDLAPLAHAFLPLLGLGKLWYKDQWRDTAYVLQQEQLEPLALGPKEGLALINGTQFIAAHAVLAVDKLHKVLSQADITGAMMLEGLKGSIRPFDPRLHALRPYQGTRHVAQRITYLLEGSEIMGSHADCARVQDPYSLRCMPQVHGASWEAWLHLKLATQTEINSVTDNPIILEDGLSISGGNFHGQPLALPIDYACLAASEIGNIADRRIYLSLEGDTPGLPKLLMRATGLNSGFMIPQYTTAALASENKGLCFPASADSIPTSLGQEDHVSMGSIGGRKLLRVIDNVEKILGIELFCAAQAMDFHRPLRSGRILDEIHAFVREEIPHLEDDQLMYPLMEQCIAWVSAGFISTFARHLADKHGLPYQTDYHEQFDQY